MMPAGLRSQALPYRYAGLIRLAGVNNRCHSLCAQSLGGPRMGLALGFVGGTIIVGSLNLGGSIDMIPNAVRIAELAVDKQAETLLMPVSSRRQLNDLPDDLWTRISIEFYKDSADALFKSLGE